MSDGPVMEAMCGHCTAPFERKIRLIKRNRGHYCSLDCAHLGRRGRDTIDVVCGRPACGKPFKREVYGMHGAKTVYCSKACQIETLRGRTMITLACETCLTLFERLPAQARRGDHHYCSRPCYFATIDRQALGLMGALAPRPNPPPPIVRFRRSQKAGFARARNLSKKRLHEIAMMAVAARRAKAAGRPGQRTDLPKKAKRGMQFIGPLLALVLKETA